MEPARDIHEPYVSFRTWTGGRSITSVGTNTGASPLPFQEWRPFKEAFAPELIEIAATQTPGPINHIVDPFGGSGTTALAGQFLGIQPTIIEVNPYLSDLIESKIAQIDVDSATVALGRVVERASQNKKNKSLRFRGAPATFVEPGVNGKFLFWRDVAERFVSYRKAIDLENDVAISRFFRVILASACVPASNIIVSGKGRRYRRGWQSRRPNPSLVDTLFQDGVIRALHDLHRFSFRKCRDYKLLRGDARELIDKVEPLDLAVFSPPYSNSFDYTDVYNVELWVLGYIKSSEMTKKLRMQTLRSHVQIHRDMSSEGINSELLRKTMQNLENAKSGIWNKHIPSMIGAYVADMAIILKGLAKKLRENGRIYMVVGNSRYANVDVPIAAILAEISPELGLMPISVDPFRSMRSSPQQGGRLELAESLIVLERH